MLSEIIYIIKWLRTTQRYDMTQKQLSHIFNTFSNKSLADLMIALDFSAETSLHYLLSDSVPTYPLFHTAKRALLRQNYDRLILNL